MRDYTVRFKVKGSGDFPVDMLRYDRCYPVSAKDVEGVMLSYAVAEVEDMITERIVQLETHVFTTKRDIIWESENRCPCDERWRSFGWRVIDRQILDL